MSHSIRNKNYTRKCNTFVVERNRVAKNMNGAIQGHTPYYDNNAIDDNNNNAVCCRYNCGTLKVIFSFENVCTQCLRHYRIWKVNDYFLRCDLVKVSSRYLTSPTNVITISWILLLVPYMILVEYYTVLICPMHGPI